MISGKKLKQIRSFRQLTQKELAIMSGLTDAAIRNYELGNRSPNKEQLRKIADALNCDISALIDHEPNSIFEIMHIIFDYEKEMKFHPLAGNGEPTALLSHRDRKSTRLNFSHANISYAVFCLKKNKQKTTSYTLWERAPTRVLYSL